MNPFYRLNQIQSIDRSFVGDKAYYLGLLMQRGYPVIPGIVVSSPAFTQFLETIRWLEPLFSDLPDSSLHLDVDNYHQLQAVSQQIRQAIEATALPGDWLHELTQQAQQWAAPAVILRPSLALKPELDPSLGGKTTGLLESRICRVEANAIEHHLKQVWAELFRARSLLYWQRWGVQLQQIQLGVLVQPLTAAIASGDAYFDQGLEVRAVWGQGQALVRGEVAPDRYTVSARSGTVQRVGSKAYAYQVLSPEPATSHSLLPPLDCLQASLVEPERQQQPALSAAQLQQLVQLTQSVAADLGSPLRLEWVLAASTPPSLQLTQVLLEKAVLHPPKLWSLPEFSSLLQSELRDEPEAALPPDPHHPIQQPKPVAQQRSFDRQSFSSEAVSLLSTPLIGLAAAGGWRSARAWVVSETQLESAQTGLDVPPGMILVVPNVAPGWLSYLKHAAGLITEQGGITSHGAIVARELGIPAVVGVAQATQLIQTGEAVIVDGDCGQVQRLASSAHPATVSPSSFTANYFPLTHHRTAKPVELLRYTATQLLVNLSQPGSAAQLAGLPIDGVGLLRSELMLMESLGQPFALEAEGWAPLIDRIAADVQEIARVVHPRPLFYRSLDLRSHEYASAVNRLNEVNPILGLHGALSYQFHLPLFQAELAALRRVQQAGLTHINLLLPFVRTVEEFRFCQAQVQQAGLAQIPHFQLWIMAEVPSVLFLLSDYVQAGVQGIAIGSNDLTQLILGVDRDHPLLADAYNPLHPAVLQAIQQLTQSAQRLGIPCSICGEAPSQSPQLIDALVRWGITAISVNLDRVEQTHAAIVRAEQRLLLDAARQQQGG